MEEDKLIKRYAEIIERPKLENKIAFLKYGVIGDFEKIREIIGFEKPKKEEVNALINICDNRIDRLKSFSQDLVTFISFAIATLTLSISIFADKITEGELILPGLAWFFGSWQYLLWKILMFSLLFLAIIFLTLLFRYKAQTNAWHALKEGFLPYKSY